VLQLLVKMGYGGLEANTEHLGSPGDGGLDGLIRLDKLGLDIPYVQAKRYTTVTSGGRTSKHSWERCTELRPAAGSSSQPQDSVPTLATTPSGVNARLILIDGPELAALMIE
jgi:restriction system protein